MVLKLGGCEAGEEAEPAKIDAQERNLAAPEPPSGGEKGSVTAEDQDHIGVCGDRLDLVLDVHTDKLTGFFDGRNDAFKSGDDGRFSLVCNDEDTHRASIVTAATGQENRVSNRR